jgi:Glycosyltransferase family 10 (fucosyltransferase) C-term
MTQTTTIALLSRHDVYSLMRQSEDGAGRFANAQVELSLHDGTSWLAVYDNISAAVPVRVPRAQRALFITEPPGIKTYNAGFANQFGLLISPVKIPGYQGRWLNAQSALPWLYWMEFISPGRIVSRLSLKDLRALPCPPDKASRISVVCSKKSQLPRHRHRLALIDHLCVAFPDKIDVFGHGFRPIPDKAMAIAPYRYHLVLENNTIDHFWTEKTADAYLGYALPLFSGCANIDDYFPAASFIRLPDIDDVTAITASIADVLNNDPFADRLNAITGARTLVLDRYNLMAVLAALVDSPNDVDRGPLAQPYLLRPARDFNGLSGWLRGRASLAS